MCADIKYVGQTSPLTVCLESFPAAPDAIATLVRKFEDEHRKTFGYISKTDALQFVALKAICQGLPETSRMPQRVERGNERTRQMSERKAFFGAEHGWLGTRVMSRAELGAHAIPGPLVIEEYDTTVVVRPGWTARVDTWNNVHMERAA